MGWKREGMAPANPQGQRHGAEIDPAFRHGLFKRKQPSSAMRADVLEEPKIGLGQMEEEGKDKKMVKKKAQRFTLSPSSFFSSR